MINDAFDIFTDALRCWMSSVDSKAGVSESAVYTHHELWCVLAKLSWIVGADRIGDCYVSTDRHMKILI